MAGECQIAKELPISLDEQEEQMVEPNQIFGTRQIHHHNQLVPQVLVQWKRQSNDEASWIDKAYFQG